MSDSVTFKRMSEMRLELKAHTVLFDRGFVELGSRVEYDEVAADMLPVSAARASFQASDKTGKNPKADLKLLGYLAEHGHVTPCEYLHASFIIEAPLFVHEQIKQHRSLRNLTMANNATSRRYTSEEIAFWIPDKWRKQSENNKQASVENDLPDGSFGLDMGSGVADVESAFGEFKRACKNCLQVYDALLDGHVAREQARAVLPQSLITTFFLGGTLRDWAVFLELRLAENVQEETRVVAKRIHRELYNLWQEPVKALVGEPE